MPHTGTLTICPAFLSLISRFFEKLQPMSGTAATSASTVSTAACSLVGGEILSSESRDWSSAGIGMLSGCLAKRGQCGAQPQNRAAGTHAAGWRRG